MKNAIRVEEINQFLRDGGSLDEILIECDPSQKKRQFSRVGLEVDQEEEKSHLNSADWWND